METSTVIEVDFISRRRVAARQRGFTDFRRQHPEQPVIRRAPFKVIEGGRHSAPSQEHKAGADADHQQPVTGDGGVVKENAGNDGEAAAHKKAEAEALAERDHHLDPFALAAVVSRLVRNLAEQQAAGGDLGAGAVGVQGRLFRESDAVQERDLFSERTHPSVLQQCDCEECEKAADGDGEGD